MWPRRDRRSIHRRSIDRGGLRQGILCRLISAGLSIGQRLGVGSQVGVLSFRRRTSGRPGGSFRRCAGCFHAGDAWNQFVDIVVVRCPGRRARLVRGTRLASRAWSAGQRRNVAATTTTAAGARRDLVRNRGDLRNIGRWLGDRQGSRRGSLQRGVRDAPRRSCLGAERSARIACHPSARISAGIANRLGVLRRALSRVGVAAMVGNPFPINDWWRDIGRRDLFVFFVVPRTEHVRAVQQPVEQSPGLFRLGWLLLIAVGLALLIVGLRARKDGEQAGSLATLIGHQLDIAGWVAVADG